MRCARCGYDLRGEASRWTSQCPMRGACVECGIAFIWKDIFSRARHPWLFEAEWRYRPLRRIVATIRNACVPPRFWRRVRMSDRIFLRPALALLLVLVLIFYVIPVGWVLWELANGAGYSRRFGYIRSGRLLTGLDWLSGIGAAMSVVPGWALGRLAPSMAMLLGLPLAFVSAPVTLGRARVRPAHIARIAIYSLIVPLLVGIGWCVCELFLRAVGLTAAAESLDPWTHYWSVSVDDNTLVIMVSDAWKPLLLITLTAAWLWWWWTSAFRHYLLFEGNRRLLIVMFVIAALAGLCAGI